MSSSYVLTYNSPGIIIEAIISCQTLSLTFARQYCTHSGQAQSESVQARIEHLENRIVGLEKLVNQKHHVEGIGTALDTSLRPEHDQWMLFRGKGYRTAFYGATHPAAYLSQVC